MDIVTHANDLANISTSELKRLYCRLFNRLASPCLPEYEKRQIRAAIQCVTAELQTRRVL